MRSAVAQEADLGIEVVLDGEVLRVQAVPVAVVVEGGGVACVAARHPGVFVRA
jgi:hypothetical protein